MERIGLLISKLKELYEENAGLSRISHTLEQLQAEIGRLQHQQQNRVAGTAKVAVVMPRRINLSPAPEEKEPAATIIEVDVPPQPDIINGSTPKTVAPASNDFNPLVEIPTLSQQKEIRELNEAMATVQASLNDRLRQEQTELFEKLKETPIRDLRKAIGVNDRFVFINELFRGDEAMYERSIKTINSFHIFAEAEYWITRELKVKLGWIEPDKTVSHFYELVKRRFS